MHLFLFDNSSSKITLSIITIWLIKRYLWNIYSYPLLVIIYRSNYNFSHCHFKYIWWFAIPPQNKLTLVDNIIIISFHLLLVAVVLLPSFPWNVFRGWINESSSLKLHFICKWRKSNHNHRHQHQHRSPVHQYPWRHHHHRHHVSLPSRNTILLTDVTYLWIRKRRGAAVAADKSRKNPCHSLYSVFKVSGSLPCHMPLSLSLLSLCPDNCAATATT